MREEIFGVVSAGIQMKFVLDTLTRQLAVELGRAFGKAVFVLPAAIEVDGLTLNLTAVFTCKVKRVIGVPMRNLDGIAKHRSQQVCQPAGVFQILVELLGSFGDERGALSAHR